MIRRGLQRQRLAFCLLAHIMRSSSVSAPRAVQQSSCSASAARGASSEPAAVTACFFLQPPPPLAGQARPLADDDDSALDDPPSMLDRLAPPPLAATDRAGPSGITAGAGGCSRAVAFGAWRETRSNLVAGLEAMLTERYEASSSAV